jgi:hypothetical protein
VRWDYRYQKAPSTGAAALDPTITQATLTDVENLFSAGIGFNL